MKYEIIDSLYGEIQNELSMINYKDHYLWISLFMILFNPTFWNILGRLEYHRNSISQRIKLKKKTACYLFAASIFILGLVRDGFYMMAVKRQPKGLSQLIGPISSGPLAQILFIFGGLLVTSSMFKLGIIGTYLGDHFGILMKEKISTFPFSVCEHPMYYGSTMLFISYALR